MQTKNISQASLQLLFDQLRSEGNTVVAPAKENGKDSVNFRPVERLEEVAADYLQTVSSAKSVVFPRKETLFTFSKNREEVVMHDPDPAEYPKVVLWGVHPCDARGLLPLKAIFDWEPKDRIFGERWEKLTVIGLSCRTADAYCFCTSVGGGPGQTTGSDILLTLLPSGDYLVEVVTEKGQKLVSEHAGLFGKDPEVSKEEYLANVPSRFDIEKVAEALRQESAFSDPVWAEYSLRCLGCATCAYVCPTCACFDIQDEGFGVKNQRFRSWDSCGLRQFTLHTSGHNPREFQGQRWRQRILHKFVQMPQRSQGTGCVGCGRCSRACPVDMNLAEQLRICGCGDERIKNI